MPKKISDDVVKKIKTLLIDGYTSKEIADELGIGEKTVKRKRKELAETNPELTQQLNESKYNRYVRQCEDKYIKKIEKEKVLFEDKEEGWVYHLSAEDLKSKQSSKWWTFIVYPESAPENWIEKLRNLQCELAISPLHDKDLWTHDSPGIVDEETGEVLEEQGARYKCGTRKKSHWHCIIKFDRMVSYTEANSIVRNITNGPYLQKCMSLKGAYEYFIHLNNPDKYQYEKDEIQKFNNFIIEATQADRVILIDEMTKVIRERKFTDIAQVAEYYQGQYEYINVLSLKAFYFEKLTQVNFRKLNPEGRTQRVKLID